MPVERIQHYLDFVQEGETTVPERYAMMKAQQERTLSEISDLQKHLSTINFKVDITLRSWRVMNPIALSPRISVKTRLTKRLSLTITLLNLEFTPKNTLLPK